MYLCVEICMWYAMHMCVSSEVVLTLDTCCLMIKRDVGGVGDPSLPIQNGPD